MLEVLREPYFRRSLKALAYWNVVRDWITNARAIRRGIRRQWDIDDLFDVYDRKLIRLLSYASVKISYYKPLMVELDELMSTNPDTTSLISRLPTLHSTTLIDSVQDIMILDLLEETGKHAYVTTSSGTSRPGERKTVFHLEDANYVPSAIAFSRLFSGWLGCRPAVIGWIDLPVDGPFLAYHTGFHLYLQLSSADLIDEPLNIQKQHIEVLIGDPVVLKRVAAAVEAQGNPVNLRLAISTSDLLDDGTRNYIGDVLGCPVADAYGMSELSAMVAMECPTHSGLHVNTDQVYVEVLDPNSDVPVQLGEVGEVVVTDLNNILMPLIRYRTGDVARVIASEWVKS